MTQNTDLLNWRRDFSPASSALFVPFVLFVANGLGNRPTPPSHPSRVRRLTERAGGNYLLGVETPAIKVLGQLRQTPWQRFVRLQLSAARLARGRGQPKGVFKFASNAACDTWTANLNRNGK